MKIFTSLKVSIDFPTKFLIVSAASGLFVANHYKCIFPKFSKIFLGFLENFDNILQTISKIRKISLKIFKIV